MVDPMPGRVRTLSYPRIPCRVCAKCAHGCAVDFAATPAITTLGWIGLALGAGLGAVVGVLWEGGAGFGVGVAVGAGLGVSAGTLVDRRRPRHSP